MALHTTVTITCDGCGKPIDQTPAYTVNLRDDSNVALHFHDYNCVKQWADTQADSRASYIRLAETHAKLHEVLKAKGIDSDTYHNQLADKGLLRRSPVSGGVAQSLEALTLEQALAEIETLETL